MGNKPQNPKEADRESDRIFSRLAFLEDEQRRARRQILDQDVYKKQLDCFFQFTREGVWIADKSGCLVFVNPRLSEILKRPIEEMIGQPIRRFLEWPPREEDAYHPFPKDPFRSRILIRTPDGREVPCSVRVQPVFDAYGRIDGTLGLVEDRTEFVRIHQAWIHSESHFNALFETTQVGIAFLDEEGRFLRANPILQGILGFNEQELQNRTCLELTYAEDQPLSREKYFQIRSGLISHGKWEKRFVRKSGEVLWCDVEISSPSPDQFPPLILLAEDISQRKQTELSLQQSEEQYRTFIENAGDIVFTIDEKGYVTSLNPAFEAITGWERREWLNRHYAPLMYPEDLPVAEQRFRQLMNREVLDPIELRFWTQDGDVVTVEIKASAQIKNDRVVGIWGISRDITSRKKEEEHLRETARLEATTTLAGGIAHDLNNLMLAVIGNAELLSLHAGSIPAAQQMLRDISRSAARASELAAQLLAYARGGKMLPALINMNDVIHHILSENPSLHSLRIKMEYGFDPDLHPVMADFNQMCQVIRNLILNAIEAIPANGRIRISTRNIEMTEKNKKSRSNLDPGAYVSVTVEDNGIGMGAETLNRLFQPFFSTKFKGRGLGLAAVYGIIKNHGGDIEVQSEEGLGTCMRLYLPTVQPAASQADPLAHGPGNPT